MKHKVKVNYVVEVEAVSHSMAIAKAMHDPNRFLSLLWASCLQHLRFPK